MKKIKKKTKLGSSLTKGLKDAVKYENGEIQLKTTSVEDIKPNVYLIKEKNKLLEGYYLNDKMTKRPIRVFIVQLLRYGDKESHHYITGIFSSYKNALKNAKEAIESRGGKYDANILSSYIDCPFDVESYRVIDWGDEY